MTIQFTIFQILFLKLLRARSLTYIQCFLVYPVLANLASLRGEINLINSKKFNAFTLKLKTDKN